MMARMPHDDLEMTEDEFDDLYARGTEVEVIFTSTGSPVGRTEYIGTWYVCGSGTGSDTEDLIPC